MQIYTIMFAYFIFYSNMKVFVLIYQRPLRIKVYSSLTALIDDDLGASRSKLEKHPFNNFDYVTHKVIISKKETLSTGDIRNKKL